jgi:hypothetical protein
LLSSKLRKDEAMIRVVIGGIERRLGEASPQWINEQINRRRADNVPICVRILINTPDLNVTLATSDCASGGGSRPPNPHEAKILSLWEHFHLNQQDFSGGNLVAFLKKIT